MVSEEPKFDIPLVHNIFFYKFHWNIKVIHLHILHSVEKRCQIVVHPIAQKCFKIHCLIKSSNVIHSRNGIFYSKNWGIEWGIIWNSCCVANNIFISKYYFLNYFSCLTKITFIHAAKQATETTQFWQIWLIFLFINI